MDRAGRVLVLNGTASAGKTSLARAFRAQAESLWLLIGQDEFASNLVDRWVHVTDVGDTVRSDGFTFVRNGDGSMVLEAGATGQRLLRGYRQAVAAMARAGNDVIVDEAKFDASGWAEWSSALQGLDATWVRVECDLQVCEARERARSDRALLHGLARGIHEQVHADVEYDLQVDTSDTTPEECAQAVLAFVESNQRRRTDPPQGQRRRS